jgi:hypothetical protein
MTEADLEAADPVLLAQQISEARSILFKVQYSRCIIVIKYVQWNFSTCTQVQDDWECSIEEGSNRPQKKDKCRH